MIKICGYCRQEFIAKHGIRDKFCSIRCSQKGQNLRDRRWRADEDDFIKSHPKMTIARIAAELKRTESSIIDRRYKLNIKWKQPLQEINCLSCGKIFKVKISRLNRLRRYPLPFCSKHCWSKWTTDKGFMRGENSPSWKGGSEYGLHWDTIRKRLPRKRCQDCGATSNLEFHHLIPPRQFLAPDFAHYPKNLECLCRTCHLKRHSNNVRRDAY